MDNTFTVNSSYKNMRVVPGDTKHNLYIPAVGNGIKASMLKSSRIGNCSVSSSHEEVTNVTFEPFTIYPVTFIEDTNAEGRGNPATQRSIDKDSMSTTTN